MKKALLGILLVALATGCTGLSGVFGGDILKIKTNIIQEGQKDILVIKDAATIPKSPMLPDQEFVFSFLLENVDKKEHAELALVELFNAPTVKNKGRELCNNVPAGNCVPDNCGPGKECETVLPGEQIPVSFELITPTEDEIVKIKTTPTLDYRVKYGFTSSSLFIMPSVDMDEIRKRQISNDKISLEMTKSYGTGPVKVDMELFGTPYILSGHDATLIFRITNNGRGEVEGSVIPPYNFVAQIPYSLAEGEVTVPDAKRFSCTNTGVFIECANTEPIQLYKDQTRGSIMFKFRTTDIDVPFLSYEIRASAAYTYELRGTQEITVKPFEG